ncbi:hypothetical protein WOLCODRAFT_139016 [Wolfiporia cocos MD-104 SS10]|uniref:Phosphatidate phosphatase APP1 catalytic domain-containing protein n=1 Tax=Wolfiporia cocos (strain MD-104) TaxID=742152 RepID=A0A2H3JQM0_WOLCO|nr:hypothetical protein WOLCODRAFT_139016 [Wolfiporia cocos MD-104 SS10]
MSDEPPSWKSLASVASRSIKTYVSQRDFKRPSPISRDISADGKKQTWGQWAGQKLRQVQGGSTPSIEGLLLFAGWATRRFHEPLSTASEDTPFDVEVFVSGFASKSSGPGFNTRPGRAFLRVAKTFAALPKLATPSNSTPEWVDTPPLSKSTEDLLASAHLPAPPDQMDENAEIEALERHLRHLEMDAESVASSATSLNPSSASSSMPSSPVANRNVPLPADLQRMHINLETRLHPFWCTALSGRTVRISLYAADPSLFHPYDGYEYRDDDPRGPLLREEVITNGDGFFQVKFQVPWDNLCLHADGLQIAFGDRHIEQELFVLTELLPPPVPRTPSGTQLQLNDLLGGPSVTASTSVPLTYTTIRLISDIDDTVKLASVVNGARAVFNNIFVRDLEDSIIPGMSEWYMRMWRRGVRFHYVSNGPFEVLPVINEFFQLCHLPPGSIKLRSYGGRSLFSGLLSAPAERKRAGVVDILNNFPDSRFFLVGDSGEQDLELYAALAKEQPTQVIAIFIRDVSGDNTRTLDDPTGARVLHMDSEVQQSPISPPLSRTSSSYQYTARTPNVRRPSDAKNAQKYIARKPTRMLSETELPPPSTDPSGGYFSSSLLNASPVTEEPQKILRQSSAGILKDAQASPQLERCESSSGGRQYMSEAERRRYDLQMRVWRARLELPGHIPLRVFRNPEECVEATTLLDGLQE